MTARGRNKQSLLELVTTDAPVRTMPVLRTIDLFSGAGGITEGFRQAGYECLYANDSMPEAIRTFELNHPETWADCGDIEKVNPVAIRAELGIAKGELDVLVGGPPCQGFSINAPDRFLKDPRNKLFKDYVRFLEEFEPKTFLFENVPGLLSLGDGKVLDRILSEFVRLDYHVSVKILFAAYYGVPQERWRLILLGSKLSEITPPEPTHFASGRANFRGGGGVLTFVYHKIAERLGGNLTEIHQQAGSLTIMWYDIGAPVPEGQIRALKLGGQSTTTIDQVALAFTAPSNLPPAKVYEQAIIAEL